MVSRQDFFLIAQGVKVLLGHDVADAFGRPTAAGAFLVIGKVVTVIIGQLLTRLEVAPGVDPDAPTHNIHLAIRIAAVIDEAGGIPVDAPIDIVLVV
jgi:hypothetical protein